MTASTAFIVFIVLETTCFIELAICSYALYRNDWVLRTRLALLHNDMGLYAKLPDYFTMLEGHGFWRWDVNYYLKEGNNATN